jgi:uncharacterized membrane protein
VRTGEGAVARVSEADETVHLLRHAQQTTAKFHARPLPSPEDLDGYEAVQRGLAERIVLMAERRSASRSARWRTGRRWNARWSSGRTVGRIAACGSRWSSLTILCAAVWLVLLDHDAAGATLAAVDVTGLAAVFVYGRRNQVRHDVVEELPVPARS